MKLLLDTHAWLWFRTGNSRLGRQARDAIADPTNDVLVSVASAWEVGTKAASGKLALARPFEIWLETALLGFDVLPVSLDHVRAATRLPPHHKDPFDRMLVAQALVDALTFVTADSQIGPYDVPQRRADV